MQVWQVTGTHGASSLRLTRQEAAVIPGYRAQENVAEARGELGPWCRFLGRSWGSRGGVAGQKERDWSSASLSSLGLCQ